MSRENLVFSFVLFKFIRSVQNKINAKSEGEEQMKSYKLVDNVDKLVYN